MYDFFSNCWIWYGWKKKKKRNLFPAINLHDEMVIILYLMILFLFPMTIYQIHWCSQIVIMSADWRRIFVRKLWSMYIFHRALFHCKKKKWTLDHCELWFFFSKYADMFSNLISNIIFFQINVSIIYTYVDSIPTLLHFSKVNKFFQSAFAKRPNQKAVVNGHQSRFQNNNFDLHLYLNFIQGQCIPHT